MFPYKTALITGASGGIGAAFAEALARAGCDLVLVARSEGKLRDLAARLRSAHGRRVEVVAADLSRPAPGEKLRQTVDALGFNVDLLVNNAGFGTMGRFETIDPVREQEEIRLNIGAVVDCTHAFLPQMLERGQGAVVNIASAAAFQPVPYMAVYAATKAFVYSFTDALWGECRERGVHLMSICPGPVETDFFEATGNPDARTMLSTPGVVTAEAVVRAALRDLRARRRLVVPGGINRLATTASRLLPRAWVALSVAKVMAPKKSR